MRQKYQNNAAAESAGTREKIIVAAFVFIIFHISLEAWLGTVISIIIVKSGFEMLKDTVSQILGERNDPELAKAIRETVTGFPDVMGAYDLVLNNYGPDSWNGSIHIAIADTYSVDKLDQLVRSIQEEVYQKHKIILTAIGIYSVNTKSTIISDAQKKVHDIVLAHEYVLQMHGFYIDNDKKSMRFDVVISFNAPDRKAVFWEVFEDITKAFPGYDVQMALDTDFSEN